MQQPFILCIDDDENSHDILRVLLCHVMGFTNIAFWLDSSNFIDRIVALTPKPDMILMDIQIRPLDGYEMLGQLRQQPDLQGIKVVALTASVMEEEVNRMRLDGFDGLIGKPIVRHLFPEIVRKLLLGESIWYIS